MKKILAVVVAGLFIFSFTGFSMAKDKGPAKGTSKVVKECKKDGTKCTSEELKDKKLRKECQNPCPAEPPVPPAGGGTPPSGS